MQLINWLGGEIVSAGDNLRRGRVHRHWADRVLHALLRKFVLRIEVQGGAELGERLHLPAVEKVAISAVQVRARQMLSRDFPGRDVFGVLRSEARSLLKFIECFLEFLRLLEF